MEREAGPAEIPLDDPETQEILELAQGGVTDDLLGCLVDRDFTALYRYCWRQSRWALREGSAGRLRGALLAQTICAAGRTPDDREVMIGLAVQHYVAQQIGLVPTDLFAETAAYLPDGEWADLVRWFGTQDDITLEDFAWQLVETPDGPDFVSTLTLLLFVKHAAAHRRETGARVEGWATPGGRRGLPGHLGCR